MAAIRSRDTKPELFVRRGLHRRGFRYLLGCRDLPGKPDLVLKRHGAVILVHGCFWHGHSCHLFRLPEARREFWQNKIEANRRRDSDVLSALAEGGWRTAVVWECALKGRQRLSEEVIFDRLIAWLQGADRSFELAGVC